jgi:hypothetical protein
MFQSVTCFQFVQWCYLVWMQVQFFSSAICVNEYETPAAVIIYERAPSGLALRDQRCSVLCPVVMIAGTLPDLGAPPTASVSLNLSVICVAMWYLKFGKISTDLCLTSSVYSCPQRYTYSTTDTGVRGTQHPFQRSCTHFNSLKQGWPTYYISSLILGVCILLRVWDQVMGVFISVYATLRRPI